MLCFVPPEGFASPEAAEHHPLQQPACSTGWQEGEISPSPHAPVLGNFVKHTKDLLTDQTLSIVFSLKE